MKSENGNPTNEFQLESIFALSNFEDSAMFAFGNDNKRLIDSPTYNDYFDKVTTENEYLIMGKNTFESFGSTALENRKMVVVSSMETSEFEEQMGCFLTRTLRDAILFCKAQGAEKAIVVGGTELLTESFPIVNTVHYTIFNHNFKFQDIDTPYFPKLLFNRKLLTTTRARDVREKCLIVPNEESKMVKFTIQKLERA